MSDNAIDTLTLAIERYLVRAFAFSKTYREMASEIAALRSYSPVQDAPADVSEALCGALKDTWAECDPSDACLENLIEQLRVRGFRISPAKGEAPAVSEEDIIAAEDTLLGWAKAYRDGPSELRFPSDPNAEVFPQDLEHVARLLASIRYSGRQPLTSGYGSEEER